MCMFAVSADASLCTIGIIDRDKAHFNDMIKIVDGRSEVTGILVENYRDIAMSIAYFITVEVKVIVMPLQLWKYDSGVARMVAVANSRGIRVIGVSDNGRRFADRLKKAFGCKVQRYIGIQYVKQSFWHSASENAIRKGLK